MEGYLVHCVVQGPSISEIKAVLLVDFAGIGFDTFVKYDVLARVASG